MPRAFKGARFQTGRGRTESGRRGARFPKKGKPKEQPQTTAAYPASYSRPCPACGTMIQKGDLLRKSGAHVDCPEQREARS
jgi:hypothetical protein